MASQQTFNFFSTYIATIKNAVGSHMFRELYMVTPEGEKTNILRDGELSCAIFVSSILKIHDLIRAPHATVSGTVLDLEASGWKVISEPRIGAILVWEKREDDRHELHGHVGFYIGDDMAISNSSELRSPQIHHYTYGTENPRKITHIFWRDDLDAK